MRSLLKTILISLLKFTVFRNILHRLFFLSLDAESPETDLCDRLIQESIKSKPLSERSAKKLAASIDSMESGLDPQLTDNKLWLHLEPIYTASRRKLYSSRKWRYGSLCIRDNAQPVFNQLANLDISIRDKVYCDLGCGAYHPFGTSLIMYINGAASTIATDIQNSDSKRAAEALLDLLQDCFFNPNAWHWSDLSREDYFARLKQFNLRALREGNLEKGLASVPMSHIITDIYQPTIPLGRIDIMSSRAVLEHFLDFELACKNLWKLMSPGGLAYHLIDLVDHRAYGSSKYHWWSFLAEDEHLIRAPANGNKLRKSEIRDCFERTGFEIIRCEVASQEKMPKGFRQQLKGRFASMPDEELESIRIRYLIRK